MTRAQTSARKWPAVAAVALHGLLLGGLVFVPAPGPVQALGAQRPDGLAWFRLAPLPEGNSAVFMPRARLSGLPPEGADGLPDAQPQDGPDSGLGALAGSNPLSDAELADVLAKDREALQAELEKMTQTAMAVPLPAVDKPAASLASGNDGSADKGPEGAVRELNLEGYPSGIVEAFMQKYKLQVVMKEIQGGRQGQNFLSSASRGPGEHYFGGATAAAGVYEVFQLNRDTVALMSRLEESAIRKRGMEPLKTRVIRIVFGIVESANGEYELGVKSLEAEKVSE